MSATQEKWGWGAALVLGDESRGREAGGMQHTTQEGEDGRDAKEWGGGAYLICG